jgi:hypothetical protein
LFVLRLGMSLGFGGRLVSWVSGPLWILV